MKRVAICTFILLFPVAAFALNINDNGYAWRKSSLDEKRVVAADLGHFFKMPATFFYDLCEYAYDTSESERLKKCIVDLAFEQGKPIRDGQGQVQSKLKQDILNVNDNGYAWRESGSIEKEEVAKELGSFFKMPATFFYNFFEYAYDTDKAERLQTSIIDLALEQGKPVREQSAEAYEEPGKDD